MIDICWALHGHFEVGRCSDILPSGIAGILCGLALLAVGQWGGGVLCGYSAGGHCRDTLPSGTPGQKRGGRGQHSFLKV